MCPFLLDMQFNERVQSFPWDGIRTNGSSISKAYPSPALVLWVQLSLGDGMTQRLIYQAQHSAILCTVMKLPKNPSAIEHSHQTWHPISPFCGSELARRSCLIRSPACLLLLFLCIQLFLRIQILFQTVHTMNIVACCDQGFELPGCVSLS